MTACAKPRAARKLAGAALNACLTFAAVAVAMSAGVAPAQWSGRDGWVEEAATKSLNVEAPGHSYLEPASVYRGRDGLVYFNESSDVTRPEEIGKVGFMRNAYDCAKDIKYVCVEHGNWRRDPGSAIDASSDPALPVYRKYLCGDGP